MNLEARIFFDLATTPPTPTIKSKNDDDDANQRNQQQQPPVILHDLTNQNTIDLVLSSATKLFPPSEKKHVEKVREKIYSKMKEQENPAGNENRNDLYLVLPASSAGHFVGLKWRGQTDSLTSSSSSKKSPLQKLLWAEVEVKVSPYLSGGKSNCVQFWRKFHVGCVGGNLPANTKEEDITNQDAASSSSLDLRSFFANSIAKTLLTIARPFPIESGIKMSLEVAAASLTQDKKFAIVGVDKTRKKVKFNSWSDHIDKWVLEQTDMVVEDLTKNFIPPATTMVNNSNNKSVSVRSWCLEPDYNSSSEVGENVALLSAADFVTSCQLMLPRAAFCQESCRNVSIASYPQFLSETFF